MAKEIERKFLVKDSSFMSLATEKHSIAQGYLSTDPMATVRVRIRDERAFLTIKGITEGCSRNEWEYEIPVADAREMLRCHEGKLIKKTRYIVPFEGHNWEIDMFEGDLSPLVLAEIELHAADETFTLPPFVGDEVSDNPSYYNSVLATKGFSA